MFRKIGLGPPLDGGGTYYYLAGLWETVLLFNPELWIYTYPKFELKISRIQFQISEIDFNIFNFEFWIMYISIILD